MDSRSLLEYTMASEGHNEQEINTIIMEYNPNAAHQLDALANIADFKDFLANPEATTWPMNWYATCEQEAKLDTIVDAF